MSWVGRGAARGVAPLLGIVLAIALASFLYFLYGTTQIQELVLAAGSPEGDSYVFSQAIAQVVNQNHPNLHIRVVGTCGSQQNLALLQQGKVQLATAQADIPAGGDARAIAVLYRDLFQLVVKRKAGIEHFADLDGHRVALQADSAENFSFAQVARHYGLTGEVVQPVPCNVNLEVGGGQGNKRETRTDLSLGLNQTLSDAFEQGGAEAVFRVRSLGSQYIAHNVQYGDGQLIPITQAEAMRIRNPAFEPALIPRGAYQGNPPIPDRNLPTVGVQRLLLTTKRLSNRVVRQIAQTLDEHRREIAYEILVEHAELRPLVTEIGRPNQAKTTGVPLHRGALAYYERDKPTLWSFLLAHGDLLITLVSLVLGGLLGLWRNLLQRQDLAEAYVQQATAGLAEVVEPDPRQRQQGLRQQQQALEQLFNQAAADLVGDRISQAAFRTFNEAYLTAQATLERRLGTAMTEVADRYLAELIQRSTQPDRQQRQTALADLLTQVEASVQTKEISLEAYRTILDALRLRGKD